MYSKWPHRSYKVNRKEKNGKNFKGAEKLRKTSPKSFKMAKLSNLYGFPPISRPPCTFFHFFLLLWTLHSKSLEENRFLKIKFFHTVLTYIWLYGHFMGEKAKRIIYVVQSFTWGLVWARFSNVITWYSIFCFNQDN